MATSIEASIAQFTLYRQKYSNAPLADCYMLTLPTKEGLELAGYYTWKAHGSAPNRQAILQGSDKINLPNDWPAPFLENGRLVRYSTESPALPHVLNTARELRSRNVDIIPIFPLLSFPYPQNQVNPRPPCSHPRLALGPVILQALADIRSHITLTNQPPENTCLFPNILNPRKLTQPSQANP